MRLLFVNYEFPPMGGGAGNATAHLARECARKGEDVLVLTSAGPGLVRNEMRDGYRVVRVPALRRRWDRSSKLQMMVFMIVACLWLPFLVRRWRPSGTLAFFGIPGGPVALMLKIILGVPYCISLRGGDVPGHQPAQLAWAHRLLGPFLRLLWCRAVAVVANGSGLHQLAQAFAPELQVKVVPNGVDIKRFTPEGRRGEGGLRLLYVGRLSAEKGLSSLLYALQKWKGDWTFTLVGDGPERNGLEGLAQELGIRERMRFQGFVSPEEIATRYAEADVFVYPSTYEGMPNAVLEAMASGLPVVAAKIPGVTDVVQDGKTGVLFPARDGDAAVRAIIDLSNDQGCRKAMGRAGLARVQNFFTWEQSAQAYLDIFNQMQPK